MDAEGKLKNIVLRRMHRCVVCHREFQVDDIDIISREDDIWTMVVECEDCHARSFVAAVLNDGDAIGAQTALRRLTDEALEQQRESRDNAPESIEIRGVKGERVDANDVVDMHEFLADFDGDFVRLFHSH